jgi:predicted RNA-binding Zn-ribbon protein involved in translation (DUF1610 family)
MIKKTPQSKNKPSSSESAVEGFVIKTCPFCGEPPLVLPKNPKTEGNAWGCVKCSNISCPAMPSIGDDIEVADDRGSDAYKLRAIERWNKRFL